MNLLLYFLLYFPFIHQENISAESFAYSFKIIHRKPAFNCSRQKFKASNSSTLDCKSIASINSSYLIGPPDNLRMLKTLDEVYHPLPETPILIKRIAFQPDMFVIKNLLPSDTDRKALIDQAISTQMKEASTKSGIVSHRTKCYVTSLSVEGQDSDNDRNSSDNQGEHIASFLEQLQAYLFVSEPFSNLIRSEPMQVLCYEPNGKYDFHHDGYHRFVTVITYLNGVAGTWFPYALISSSATKEDEEETPPEMKLTGEGMAVDKVPGKDGVLVVGKMDHKYMSNNDDDSPHVVQIEPGDAIVFYNYQWMSKKDMREKMDFDRDDRTTMNLQEEMLMMNWRSLHSGLPATQEKWIATNWFAYDG
jgi:hypothetical protein